MSEAKNPAILSRTQVARELGVSKDAVMRLERAGALPPVLKMPGGSWWSARDVERVKGGVLPDKAGGSR